MTAYWQHLKNIPEFEAVLSEWKRHFGPIYDGLKCCCLTATGNDARSVTCPNRCGCDHEVIQHLDGAIVATCCCESYACDSFTLTKENIEVWKLDAHKLAANIRKAFSFAACQDDLGIPRTQQFAKITDQAYPIILTLACDQEALRSLISELIAKLNTQFILFVPTGTLIDGTTKGLLARNKCVLFPLETTIALSPNGLVTRTEEAKELLHIFTTNTSASPENVVRLALTYLERFDEKHRTVVRPSHSEFFRLYCAHGLSISQIVNETGCSRGTASTRKSQCEVIVKNPLSTYREYGPLIERECVSTSVAKAQIYDDAGFTDDDD